LLSLQIYKEMVSRVAPISLAKEEAVSAVTDQNFEKDPCDLGAQYVSCVNGLEDCEDDTFSLTTASSGHQGPT
jgi:hypothetical protein